MDLLRKAFAAALFVVALVGLLPLVPLVFGYAASNVTNDPNGTKYPTASAVSNTWIACSHISTATTLGKNTTYTNAALFQCTNNWNAAVTVSISNPTSNGLYASFTSGPAVLINPGATACVTATFKAANRPSNTTVLYRATATASNLNAQFDFTAVAKTLNGAAPVFCV